MAKKSQKLEILRQEAAIAFGQADTNKSSKDARVQKINDYYFMRLPKPIGKNTSKMIVPVVKTKVDDMDASMKGIFDVQNQAVKFLPIDTNDAELAKQGTEAVNYYLRKCNFHKHLNFRETLISDQLIVKRFWEERRVHREQAFFDVTRTELKALQSKLEDIYEDVRVEIDGESYRKDPIIEQQPVLDELGRPVMDESGQPAIQEVQVGEKRVNTVYGTLRYDVIQEGLTAFRVPSQEIFTLNGDDNVESAGYLCHQTLVRRWELYDMFPGKDAVIKRAVPATLQEREYINRFDQEQPTTGSGNNMDLDLVTLREHYVRSRAFGRSRLYQVFTLSDDNLLLETNEVDEIPFTIGHAQTPDSEMYGQSFAEPLVHQQDLETTLQRLILDNAKQAAYPRYQAVEGQYDRRSLLDNQPGGVIEMKAPGMVNDMPIHQLPNSVLQLTPIASSTSDKVAGTSNEAIGTEDNMFNSTAAAVMYAKTQREAKLKSLATNLATTFFEPFYLACYRLIRTNLKSKLEIVIDGQPTEVNPMDWPERDTVKVDIVTKADKTETANKINTYVTMRANFGRTPLPNEEQAIAERVAKAFDIEDLHKEMLSYQELPQPEPSQEQILNEQKIQVEIQKLQSEAQAVNIKAQVELADQDLRRDELIAKVSMESDDRELKKLTLANSEKARKENQEIEMIKMNSDIQLTTQTGEPQAIGTPNATVTNVL